MKFDIKSSFNNWN